MPGGSVIAKPLDANSAFNSNDLVFWAGAKAYKFFDRVSENFADGISIYLSDVKACRSNG